MRKLRDECIDVKETRCINEAPSVRIQLPGLEILQKVLSLAPEVINGLHDAMAPSHDGSSHEETFACSLTKRTSHPIYAASSSNACTDRTTKAASMKMEKLQNEREQQCFCTGGPARRGEPMVLITGGIPALSSNDRAASSTL